MKNTICLLIFLAGASFITAQSNFKTHQAKPITSAQPFRPAEGIPSLDCNAREIKEFHVQPMPSPHARHKDIEKFTLSSSGGVYIAMKPNELWSSRNDVNELISELMPASVFEGNWNMEWKEVRSHVDEKNYEHVRVEQLLAGHPIHGKEMILHIANGQLRDLNGFAWTGTTPKKLPAPANPELAMETVVTYLTGQGVSFQKKPSLAGLNLTDDKVKLCWLPQKGKLVLTYEISIHPNLLDHWTIYVDAVSLEVIKAYSQLCSIFPSQLYEDIKPHVCEHDHSNDLRSDHAESTSLLMDGPTMANDQDMLGQNRLVHAYQVGSNFFLIDASRPGMYNANQSVMPNEPNGVIWTIDGQNGSPQKDNFEAIHCSTTNNNWEALEVSAHFNAGESYEYFRQKFNRNSLNGNGGNIISLVNISDENGEGLDNAFWNGAAMFYGNGNTAFKPLARGLDVAGHEMSHGVIQNTANLEYVAQSGAMNESFADIFGAMIDRNDWTLGEDVVNISVFPTGAMRDMEDPNNGGNSLGDRGWQPKHMNQFVTLPNTPEGDNGGVHINSGIPNHAFFRFATSVGKEKAEQVYYKALRDYLVKSSQFIDLRIAVEKAAADLHGANSPEVTAARNAFDAVGIGAGSGGDYEEDIEVNEGEEFIIATDFNEDFLYWIPPFDPDANIQLDAPSPLSKPSFTDDGVSCVYVSRQNEIILINFDWTGSTLDYEWFFLESNPQGIWRNIVVSKDGSKLAYTTTSLTNEIGIFDFNSNSSLNYILYNPTTAEGIVTGDVLYADAMEWDYSGEYVMYDALNRIESTFGDGIEYWDISFLKAWENGSDDFGDGFIEKLFNSLPENVDIGNPSFAKNSPYIITFDYLETYFDNFGQLQSEYHILAANIEAGYVNDIYQNTTLGYPVYSRLDDVIMFSYTDGFNIYLSVIGVQQDDKTLPVIGSETAIVIGAQKGVLFHTGDRQFTSTEEASHTKIQVYPQPATDVIMLSGWDAEGTLAYTITDIQGVVIRNGITEKNKQIDISSLVAGMYIVRVEQPDGKTGMSKFIRL